MPPRTSLFFVSALVSASCAIEPDVGVSAHAIEEDCLPADCPENVASMGKDIFFHELYLPGFLENSANVSFRGAFSPTGKPMVLTVEGDRLVGRIGRTTYAGLEMKGAGFILGVREDGSNEIEDFMITIQEVVEQEVWAQPQSGLTTNRRPRGVSPDDKTTMAYLFKYQAASGDKGPLCTRTPEDYDDDVDPIGHTRLAYVNAGDRYGDDRTISEDDTGWFNIACAGSGMAKMHLLRHAAGTASVSFQPELTQRQAMLRMLTDDICGTGLSFTVDGERVHYEDKLGAHLLGDGPMGSVEALWSSEGAICLDTPRRAKEFGKDIMDLIVKECGRELPRCESIDDWAQRAYGISRNPDGQ